MFIIKTEKHNNDGNNDFQNFLFFPNYAIIFFGNFTCMFFVFIPDNKKLLFFLSNFNDFIQIKNIYIMFKY